MIKVIVQKLETLEHLHWHYNMKEIKVKGHPDLIRDVSSKAIVNKNLLDYENYMKASKFRLSEKNKIDNMEKDLSELKNEIDDIKSLLIDLINKA